MSFARLVKRHGKTRTGKLYLPNQRAEEKREARELGWETRDIMRDLMTRPDEARKEGIIGRGMNSKVYRSLKAQVRRLDRRDGVPKELTVPALKARMAIYHYNCAQDRAFRTRMAR